MTSLSSRLRFGAPSAAPYSTRRYFLQQSAIAAAVMAVSPSLNAMNAVRPVDFNTMHSDDPALTSDPRIKQLMQRSIDAAIAAGASYADARLSHTRNRNLRGVSYATGGQSQRFVPIETEEISVGVRALVKGYWGFAASPIWTFDEGARLGKEATRQAATNSLGKARVMALAPVPIVKNGSWSTPIEIDPFSIHPSQMLDILMGIAAHASTRFSSARSQVGGRFTRQDRAVATSEGTYFTQRRYSTSGGFNLELLGEGVVTADFLGSAGIGWELIDEEKIRDAIDPLVEEMRWNMSLPVLPIDVGRYETVLGADMVARFVSGTIGAATELDRALGYEANAGGTSYLNEPLQMLGAYKVGSQHLSVTADRSMVRGLATVQWDDEGVVPIPTQLVKNGVLTNYQTTREGAAWLAAEKSGMAATSSGCAYSPAGIDSPMTHTANLVMHPGSEALTYNDLIKSVKKGVAVNVGGLHLDFQKLNGLAFPATTAYEILNGKIVGRLLNSAIMFRSPEFWKGVTAVGGPGSERTTPDGARKGEPPQDSSFTVQAVPILHEGLNFIDPTRKA